MTPHRPVDNMNPAPEAEPSTVQTGAPWLPPGRDVELPGVGRTFVRDSGGPAGAPVVLLLHGWAVTADLNFFTAYPTLAERYRVIALDHRGHGRGVRTADGIVRLTDCADDAASVLDILGIHQAIVVGYSMGGAIAQLLWRRHPDRVAGLVLASTARHFQSGPLSGVWYRSHTPLAHAAHRLPGPADALVRRRIDRRVSGDGRADWMRSELERVSPAGLLSSMRSLGRFSSVDWIGGCDRPTSVVITEQDQTIPAWAQRRLAAAITGAESYPFDGPHDSIVTAADRYVPVLAAAVDHVAEGSAE